MGISEKLPIYLIPNLINIRGGDSMTNELYHHGIKGQKWGDKNGPPYPLSASSHSLSEKKEGTKGWTKKAKAEHKSYGKSKSDPEQTKNQD